MRGVRLGITVPEIYEMQARAIFEATIRASTKGAPVVPEIMIPLVSARREVELVKGRVDAIAAAVRAETGKDFAYRLGVMVETPRAALRAGEIAEHSAFLSFGTKRPDADDLRTQPGRRGPLHVGLCAAGRVRGRTRSSSSTSTGWANCFCSGRRGGARHGRT